MILTQACLKVMDNGHIKVLLMQGSGNQPWDSLAQDNNLMNRGIVIRRE